MSTLDIPAVATASGVATAGPSVTVTLPFLEVTVKDTLGRPEWMTQALVDVIVERSHAPIVDFDGDRAVVTHAGLMTADERTRFVAHVEDYFGAGVFVVPEAVSP